MSNQAQAPKMSTATEGEGDISEGSSSQHDMDDQEEHMDTNDCTLSSAEVSAFEKNLKMYTDRCVDAHKILL